MPKGKKRSQADYEREAIKAVQRFKRKYGDTAIKASINDARWIEFLKEIGVQTVEASFWSDVQDRMKILAPPQRPEEKATQRQTRRELSIPKGILDDYNADIARFNIYSKPIIAYRDKATGRFISSKVFYQ